MWPIWLWHKAGDGCHVWWAKEISTVFDSQDCNNEVPQSEGHSSVWKQGVGRLCSLQRPRRASVLASFVLGWLPALFGLWLRTFSASVFTWPSPICVCLSGLTLIRTLVIGFRAHLDNPRWSYLKALSIVTKLHLQRLYGGSTSFASPSSRWLLAFHDLWPPSPQSLSPRSHCLLLFSLCVRSPSAFFSFVIVVF